MEQNLAPNSIFDQDESNAEPLMVVFGRFKDNTIITPEEDVIQCVTYRSTREIIDNKYGFYHLKIFGGITDWTIFQYVLIDDSIQ